MQFVQPTPSAKQVDNAIKTLQAFARRKTPGLKYGTHRKYQHSNKTRPLYDYSLDATMRKHGYRKTATGYIKKTISKKP